MLTATRQSSDHSAGSKKMGLPRIGGVTNRSDLVQALIIDGYPNPDAALTRVLDVIGLALSLGETVSIRNFGKFEPRTRGAVTRRNPKTGAPVEVPEKYTVGFIPATALRTRLNRS